MWKAVGTGVEVGQGGLETLRTACASFVHVTGFAAFGGLVTFLSWEQVRTIGGTTGL